MKKIEKVLVGGGTGYIGRNLCKVLSNRYPDAQIQAISRKPTPKGITWDDIDKLGIPDDCNAIFNVVGRNILKSRWTLSEKHRLIDSRVLPTEKLVKAIDARGSDSQLELFVCASGTSYPSDSKKIYTEEDPFGSAFPGELCKKWEDSANKLRDERVRKVIARLGVVISGDGGMVKDLRIPFSLGLGGVIGSGTQYMPWIHMEDVTSALVEVLEDERYRGVYNFVAPEQITNLDFTTEMANAMGYPRTYVTIPSFVFSLALGESSYMVLEGCMASSEKLESAGYEFKYRTIRSALTSIFKKNK